MFHFQFLFCTVDSVCVQQEDKKGKSGRSLNDESRDEAGDRRKGMFFSWSRNRSFGKGPKKRELADFNYSKSRSRVSTPQSSAVVSGRLFLGIVTEGFCFVSLLLRFCWQQRPSGVPGFSVVRGQSGAGHLRVGEERGQLLSPASSNASLLSEPGVLNWCRIRTHIFSLIVKIRHIYPVKIKAPAHLFQCLVNKLVKY